MDYNLCDINTIKSLLDKYDFHFSKKLGQNFIIDDSVCPAMADALRANKNTGVLEIGPGIGVLTKELCKTSGKVVSVEIDSRLYPLLEETLDGYDNFNLVKGDITKLDIASLIKKEFAAFDSVKICANLPYYITSPVIIKLLESDLDADSIVVMVQREAADRLCARLGERNAGAVTAAVNYYADADILFDVSRECFVPSPKVDSCVIRLTPRKSKPYEIENEKQFFSFVKAAFSQRRKTLVNSLCATTHLPKDKISQALMNLSIAQNERAENLTLEEMIRLYNMLYFEKQSANTTNKEENLCSEK